MIRAIVTLAMCASLACGHPKVAMIGGVATVAGLGVGAPLAHECTKDEPDDCGAARYAVFIATGAAVGALVGWWLHGQWRDGEDQTVRAKAKGTDWQRLGARPVAQGPAVQGRSVGSSCLAAKLHVADVLAAGCDDRGFTGGVTQLPALDMTCACDDDGCAVRGVAVCTTAGVTFHVHGIGARGDRADAAEIAEDDAVRLCLERGGEARDVRIECACEDDTCGCVADLACSAARAVP